MYKPGDVGQSEYHGGYGAAYERRMILVAHDERLHAHRNDGQRVNEVVVIGRYEGVELARKDELTIDRVQAPEDERHELIDCNQSRLYDIHRYI